MAVPSDGGCAHDAVHGNGCGRGYDNDERKSNAQNSDHLFIAVQ